MPLYSHTYSELFTKLDWLLKQEREGADSASADKFRSLPSTQAKSVITDTLKSLVDSAPERYERELIIRCYDAPDYKRIERGYYNIDIDGEFVAGNILMLPPRIKRCGAFRVESDRWQVLFDSSQSNLSIYSPAHNEISNADGWVKDYELIIRAVVYPQDIKTNITAKTPTSATADANGFVTLNFSTAHGLAYEDYVTLANFTTTQLNGKWYVCHVPSTTSVIIYTGHTATITIGTGTVTLNTDSQIIEIDDSFYEYLQLEIKRRAFGRNGAALSTYEYSLMKEYAAAWTNSPGRVSKRAARSFRGYGFGKR